jgi:hypothetical protein
MYIYMYMYMYMYIYNHYIYIIIYLHNNIGTIWIVTLITLKDTAMMNNDRIRMMEPVVIVCNSVVSPTTIVIYMEHSETNMEHNH